MAKIKIDAALFARAKKVVEQAGYSSLDEFVTHIIEKAVAQYEQADADDNISDQLRGLGYIE
mgnify:CR=1 FL=1